MGVSIEKLNRIFDSMDYNVINEAAAKQYRTLIQLSNNISPETARNCLIDLYHDLCLEMDKSVGAEFLAATAIAMSRYFFELVQMVCVEHGRLSVETMKRISNFREVSNSFKTTIQGGVHIPIINGVSYDMILLYKKLCKHFVEVLANYQFDFSNTSLLHFISQLMRESARMKSIICMCVSPISQRFASVIANNMGDLAITLKPVLNYPLEISLNDTVFLVGERMAGKDIKYAVSEFVSKMTTDNIGVQNKTADIIAGIDALLKFAAIEPKKEPEAIANEPKNEDMEVTDITNTVALETAEPVEEEIMLEEEPDIPEPFSRDSNSYKCAVAMHNLRIVSGNTFKACAELLQKCKDSDGAREFEKLLSCGTLAELVEARVTSMESLNKLVQAMLTTLDKG